MNYIHVYSEYMYEQLKDIVKDIVCDVANIIQQ